MIDDICGCPGTDCPLKFKCQRWCETEMIAGTPYFIFVPYNKKTGTCDKLVNRETVDKNRRRKDD